MARVSRTWIDANVELAKCEGKSVMLALLSGVKVPHGGFETDLRAEEAENIDYGKVDKDFRINVPGYGWCDAASYPATKRATSRSSYKFRLPKGFRKSKY